jgi:hypothetical protein
MDSPLAAQIMLLVLPHQVTAPSSPQPPILVLRAPTLAAAQRHRSSSEWALMAGRRPPLRRSTRVRDPSLFYDMSAHAHGPHTGSYPHGSADNIGVITSFICNELTNTCKANQAAKDLCTQAESAANSATPPLSGGQADGTCLDW